MNSDVDAYIERSQKWPEEMRVLRPIMLGAGLDEGIKWRSPCYSHGGKNIAIFQEFNDCLSLMFFKGALLEDPDDLLVEQGPNSRSARRVEFRSPDDVVKLTENVRAFLDAAVAIEEAGLKVDAPADLVLVEELRDRLDADPALEAAFESLTPGRQREYNLYFSGAKHAKTRAARVDKYAEKILAGKGLRDR